MAVQRDQPYPGCNFLVDLGDGVTDSSEAGFLEVILPEGAIRVLEYRSGNDRELASRKITALTRYQNLILTRGFSGSLRLYQWWDQVRNGQNAQRTITVHIQSEDLSQVGLSLRFLRAWPVGYRLSPLNAVSESILTETLEVAVERFELE